MESTNETVNTSPEEKTYTEKELQSYADKRVTEAMKTARTKFENEKKEAERLASMTAEERYTEELSKREQALAEREKQVMLLENKQAAAVALNDLGLSINLANLVVAESAEEMKTRIDILGKEFNACVQAEVEKRLKGSTPRTTQSEGFSKEQFRKLSLKEQQEMFRTNPELYKQFI